MAKEWRKVWQLTGLEIPRFEILLVDPLHPGEPRWQDGSDDHRQRHDSIPAALRVAHQYLTQPELDVLDAQAEALQEALRADDVLKVREGLLQDVAIEKEEDREGLVLIPLLVALSRAATRVSADAVRPTVSCKW